MMTLFAQNLDRCLQNMQIRQDAMLASRTELNDMPLLPECMGWNAQIEQAQAEHASAKELEIADMGA